MLKGSSEKLLALIAMKTARLLMLAAIIQPSHRSEKSLVRKPAPKELGRVHTNRRASTMRANCRKARKTRSSFSKREKMRRKPLSLRKSRSISLRFL